MASIEIGLPECCFLEDLPDITFADVPRAVSTWVMLNGTYILKDVKLSPNQSGKVIVYAKDMLRNILPLSTPRQNRRYQATLQVQIRIESLNLDPDEVLTTSGTVLPGGTNGEKEIDEVWFSQNFLTWQPQVIETTRMQPQFLTYVPTSVIKNDRVLSRLYTKDRQTYDKAIYIETGSSSLYIQQLETSFARLWAGQCETEDLDPLCYDVFSQSLLPQRYIIRPDRYNDVCFGFENTLGGFDTLMLEGKQLYQPEGDVTTFKTSDAEQELVNGFTSIWEANTGRLETEQQATQFQDFLKSRNRHLYQNGAWHRIVVTEYKVKHSRGESNSYSFKYHLATRNEGRLFERSQLNEPDLPTNFFQRHDYKAM